MDDIKKEIPQIYSAISIVLNNNFDKESIIKELRNIGICSMLVQKPRFEPTICINIAEVKNQRLWELDEALSKTFAQVEGCLPKIKEIVNKYDSELWIDIAFYQYGTYPALIIGGRNMRKIHYLEANISIDPY